MPKILLLIIPFLLCCNKEKETTTNVNLNDGLQLNILFNNNLLEDINKVNGVNKKTTFVNDRKNKANSAIHFNRADSAEIVFGDIENASFANNIFSVSCWVLLEDTLKPCAILSKRSAFGGFEYSIDNHFRNKQFFNFDNWIASGTNTVYGIDPLNASAQINLNTWQHLVFVADGSTLKVYKNGVLQNGIDNRNINESFTNTDKPFVIGNGGGYGRNYYFQGAIDDIKMYNRVLNDDEIKYLFEE
jgi:hypothetical protein